MIAIAFRLVFFSCSGPDDKAFEPKSSAKGCSSTRDPKGHINIRILQSTAPGILLVLGHVIRMEDPYAERPYSHLEVYSFMECLLEALVQSRSYGPLG